MPARKRDDARDLIADGKDPSLEKQRQKLRGEALAANTFTAISQEFAQNAGATAIGHGLRPRLSAANISSVCLTIRSVEWRSMRSNRAMR